MGDFTFKFMCSFLDDVTVLIFDSLLICWRHKQSLSCLCTCVILVPCGIKTVTLKWASFLMMVPIGLPTFSDFPEFEN